MARDGQRNATKSKKKQKRALETYGELLKKAGRCFYSALGMMGMGMGMGMVAGMGMGMVLMMICVDQDRHNMYAANAVSAVLYYLNNAEAAKAILSDV